jgi:hypothetical protein
MTECFMSTLIGVAGGSIITGAIFLMEVVKMRNVIDGLSSTLLVYRGEIERLRCENHE